jgi:hypothetical protein
MPIDIPAAELVRQLRRIGLRPPQKLVERILEQPEAAREPLMELALETSALFSEQPECWGPIHALRLLGQLRDSQIVEPLLGAFPLPLEDDDQEAVALWAAEAPQIIGSLGEAATATLWAWLDDADRPLLARAAAAEALPYTAAADPALREGVIAGFRSRLAEAEGRDLAALLVNALGRLGAGEAYGEVMAAYRAGRVDADILSAASARQLLLRPGGAPSLKCANHTLWERYDEHGPRAEQAAA